MDVTLSSLKTYRYNCNKTKSYQIQRGFLLLFIFPPSKLLPSSRMPSDFYPQQITIVQVSDPRSVPTIWTVPYLLSLLLATQCSSPQAIPRWPPSLVITLPQLGQSIHQGAVLILSNESCISPPVWWFHRPRASCGSKTLPRHTASHWPG